MTRRIVSAGIALGALTATATALAASQQYNGPAGSGPNAGVEFGAKLSDGHPSSVRRFEFHNIPAQCSGSRPSAVTDRLAITMKVSAHRTFKGSGPVNGGRATARVSGRFSSSSPKATGTLRVTGTVTGCPMADTGAVSWTAPKIGHPH